MDESYGAKNMTRDLELIKSTTVKRVDLTCLKLFFICLFIATFVMGVIEKGLVIFLTDCRMKTTVNSTWFLNLAIADFIVALSPMLHLFICIVNMCREYILLVFWTLLRPDLFARSYFFVLICLDRCLYTWLVVWAQNGRTVFKARIISMIIFASSIIFSLHGSDSEFFPVIWYYFTVIFLMPVLIIVSSYIAIGVGIKRLKIEKKLRSYRLIITLISAFLTCWFPFYVCFFSALISIKNNNLSASHQEVFNIVKDISNFLIYLNSCLNPILNVFTCYDYKKKLKESLLLVLETAFAI